MSHLIEERKEKVRDVAMETKDDYKFDRGVILERITMSADTLESLRY